MKCLLTTILLFLSGMAFGQKMPETSAYKISETLPDKVIVAEIAPVSAATVKSKLTYYWYYGDAIHSSRGGYSGQLLNGQYTEYYPDKNLKETGNFKKGLKNGNWKSWDESGNLLSETTWKNGIDITGSKPPIWKRLHVFKKRRKSTPDSVKKAS